MPSYSGKAAEKGELQGQFSISFTHWLCKKPTEATQVTSYRTPVHPRGCFRNRQLKNSRQGKFPACHPYHSPRRARWGFKRWRRMPFLTAPGHGGPGADGELDQLPLAQPTHSVPTLRGHLRGTQAELAFSDLLC